MALSIAAGLVDRHDPRMTKAGQRPALRSGIGPGPEPWVPLPDEAASEPLGVQEKGQRHGRPWRDVPLPTRPESRTDSIVFQPFLTSSYSCPAPSRTLAREAGRSPDCWASRGSRPLYPTPSDPRGQMDQHTPRHSPAKPGLAENEHPRNRLHGIRKARRKTHRCRTLGGTKAGMWSQSVGLECDPSSTSSVQKGELSIPAPRSTPRMGMKIARAMARAHLSILNPRRSPRPWEAS